MSWLFSFLLLCYVAVRVVLRVRGQLRWIAIRETLPVPPPLVDAPEHLSPPLAELFVDSLALRADLVRARRTLAEVAVKDPDAPLGRVRDASYRRTLMETWSRINEWLRAIEELDPTSIGELADLHIAPERIARLRDSLYSTWSTVARARALDPFELDDLLAVQQTFEGIEIELAGIEQRLAKLGDNPYRNRQVVVDSPPDGPGSSEVGDEVGFVPGSRAYRAEQTWSSP